MEEKAEQEELNRKDDGLGTLQVVQDITQFLIAFVEPYQLSEFLSCGFLFFFRYRNLVNTYTCPSSCAIVKAVHSPLSSTKEQLLDG